MRVKEIANKLPIIMDNGSSLTKTGFIDAELPTVFPTLIGHPKYQLAMPGMARDFFVGREVSDLRGVLTIEFPVQHGLIKNWENMVKIWSSTFHELKVNPTKHPILLTDKALNPKQNRETIAQIMFESFSVPSLYIHSETALSLYASGRTTGCVVESGYEITDIVPVYMGTAITPAINRLYLAGKDITEYLSRILVESGYFFTDAREREHVNKMKEVLCYVQLDPREPEKVKEKEFTLPDGQTITLSTELYRAPELIFSPGGVGKTSPPLDNAIFDSIMKCDMDLRAELFGNIILSGGSTMFPGLEERLKRELSELVPEGIKVEVIVPPNRQYSVWIGASILAKQDKFKKMWISKEEYKDQGPSVIHRCI